MEPNEALAGGHSPTPIAGKPRGRLVVGATLVVVCAIVAALAALLSVRANGFALAGRSATADWQTYHDPLGLFSMRLPPGWTASSSLSSYTEGIGDESMGGHDETIRFSDPSLGAASANISVWAYPLTNLSLAQRLECTSRPQETGSFNGYPASPYGPPTITFESGNAHFQIDEVIPGILEPPSLGGGPNWAQQPRPTPLPFETVRTDRMLLDEALATFQPTNPHPLICR